MSARVVAVRVPRLSSHEKARARREVVALVEGVGRQRRYAARLRDVAKRVSFPARKALAIAETLELSDAAGVVETIRVGWDGARTKVIVAGVVVRGKRVLVHPMPWFAERVTLAAIEKAIAACACARRGPHRVGKLEALADLLTEGGLPVEPASLGRMLRRKRKKRTI